MQAQFDALFDPLTHEDDALQAYAITISDPQVEDPAGVPISLGFNATRTLKPQIKISVQATANASGFAFVSVCMDGWIADPVGVVEYASYSGGTQGFPVWYNSASYLGTAIPTSAITTATTGVLAAPMQLLDPQVSTTTNYRQVACGMKVYSDAPAQTAQGRILIGSTTRPYDSGQTGGFEGADFNEVWGYPADLSHCESRPCAGWQSGECLHAFAVPSDPDAFRFRVPPATGSATAGFPQMCAILSGGAAGQTFTAEITYDYEFTIGDTHITGVDANPSVTVDGSRLTNVLSLMGAGGKSRTNFVPASQSSNQILAGNGVHAAVAELAQTRPGKLKHMAKRIPAQSMFSNILGHGMRFMKANKPIIRAIVSKVPYVGSFLSKLF